MNQFDGSWLEVWSMFDVGIEAVTCFGTIAHYGAVWLVEMRDWASLIVIEQATVTKTISSSRPVR